MGSCYPRERGSDVVILGAGFSKEISEQMPLLNELSSAAIERLSNRNDHSTVPFLDGETKNVELAMTYLSQRHPWLSEVEFLHNRARSLDIVQAVGEEIERRTLAVVEAPCPGWLQRLVHWLHYRRATVITLNYDTLLERAYSTIEIGQTGSGPEAMFYYVEPATLYPLSFRAVQGGLGAAGVPASEVLKLHGSTNWLYSPADHRSLVRRSFSGIRQGGTPKTCLRPLLLTAAGHRS